MNVLKWNSKHTYQRHGCIYVFSTDPELLLFITVAHDDTDGESETASDANEIQYLAHQQRATGKNEF